MSTANLDQVDLAGTPGGPQFHEDLLDKINDISPEDLPMTDICGSATSTAHLKEWIEEQLEAANPDNAHVDGADLTGDDTVTGQRKANYHQTAAKRIPVSDRARNINSVGAGDELVRQVTRRNRALRRDVEASISSNNIAVAGDANTVASKAAGIGGFVGSSGAGNSARGVGGADPVLSDTSGAEDGGFPTTIATAGTGRAITHTLFKAALRQAYEQGGNLAYAMGTPEVIEIVSDYMYSSTARIAAMQTNVGQSNRQGADSGAGTAGGGIVAQGAVNVYVGNFGSVIMTPNRFQPETATDESSLFFIDPEMWDLSFLQGYQMKELATVGLATNRAISVDYTLCALAERSGAVIADIDETAAMTD